MFAVDPDGNVWGTMGQGAVDKPLSVTVTIPVSSPGPVTVTVSDSKRRNGMYVVRPGMPAVVARPFKGLMNLQWMGADGQAKTTKVMVTGSRAVELSDVAK
jgi:hypothetical protein